jgi:hypothetical protein
VLSLFSSFSSRIEPAEEEFGDVGAGELVDCQALSAFGGEDAD